MFTCCVAVLNPLAGNSAFSMLMRNQSPQDAKSIPYSSGRGEDPSHTPPGGGCHRLILFTRISRRCRFKRHRHMHCLQLKFSKEAFKSGNGDVLYHTYEKDLLQEMFRW
jgi:hypothetical protein